MLAELQPSGAGQGPNPADQHLGNGSTGPVAAGMQDPRRRMGTLESQRQPCSLPVEGDSPPEQGVDLGAGGFAKQPHRGVVV